MCNFCFQISDLLYTWCGRIFTLAVEEKPKRGFFLSSRSTGGGRSLPEKSFEKRMQMVHSKPIFAHKIVCNFCFQISDLLYTWCGKIFTLAVEEKPKRGIFYLLAVRGGGSGSPRENFWKTDANGAFWAHFCRVRVDFPQKRVCNFCFQSSDLHDAGDFFPSAWGGSSRFCWFFFFWKTDTNDTFWVHS